MEFKIGICGWGTVAKALHGLCERNAEEIFVRCGVRVKIVAMSTRTRPQSMPVGVQPYANVLEIPTAPDLDAVVELIGGTDTAAEIARSTLAAGRHLITANKALLAVRGSEFGELATKHQVRIGCEGAVGGAIPLLRTIRSCFTGDRILGIYGILNGTCNFILSKMEEECTFEQALAQAQEQGFAEADPTLDIDGTDAAQKLAIMSHLAFATSLDLSDVDKEGLTGLQPFDLQMAQKFGYHIRHLSKAHPLDGDVEARVYPALVPEEISLAQVKAQTNAVLFQCEAAGEQFFRGAGAGGDATASSVLADIVDIALHPSSAEWLGASSSGRMRSSADYVCRRYLRLDLRHEPGALSRLTALVGGTGINIEAVEQHGAHPTGADQSRRVVLLLNHSPECAMKQLLKELRALPDLVGEPFQLRVLSIADSPSP